MTSVRCPICGRNMASADGEGLSAMLRNHLSDEHDVEVLKESDRPAGPAATTGSGKGLAEDVPPTKEGGRIHRAELRREEQFYAPEEGTEIPPRPKGIGDWVKKALGTDAEADESKDEWARGEGYPMLIGPEKRTPERTEVSTLTAEERALEGKGLVWIECPVCGEVIAGMDADKLSGDLKEHMAGTHQIGSKEPLLRT
jgi:ribosomal protein S27E